MKKKSLIEKWLLNLAVAALRVVRLQEKIILLIWRIFGNYDERTERRGIQKLFWNKKYVTKWHTVYYVQ